MPSYCVNYRSHIRATLLSVSIQQNDHYVYKLLFSLIILHHLVDNQMFTGFTFNEDEIRKMLNYYSGRKFTDIRNKTMLTMFFDTGMRLNEVLTLKQEQIHDEYILVHGKGNKERLVPVSPFLAKLLLKYRVVRDSFFHINTIPQNYVFVSYRGQQLGQQAVTNILKEAADAVGVRKDIRVSPHTCRHTFAHMQLKNGLDLSQATWCQVKHGTHFRNVIKQCIHLFHAHRLNILLS